MKKRSFILLVLMAMCSVFCLTACKDGPAGPKGETGERGAIGPQGIQGVEGEKGATGERGPKGETGVQGIPGDKGDKGDTGAKGEDGREVEFSVNAQGIQWRYVGDAEWQVLLTFTDLIGYQSEYSVHYELNGGTAELEDLANVRYKSVITLPTAVTKDGAHLLGWSDGEKLFTETYEVLADATLTAVFGHKVTFDFNGGEEAALYASFDQLAADFVKDFNATTGTSGTVDAFYTYAGEVHLPDFTSNAGMMAKWGWFLNKLCDIRQAEKDVIAQEAIAAGAGSGNSNAEDWDGNHYRAQINNEVNDETLRVGIIKEIAALFKGDRQTYYSLYTMNWASEKAATYKDEFMALTIVKVDTEQMVEEGKTVKLGALAKGNENFKGWYLEDVLVDASYVPTADITLKAQFGSEFKVEATEGVGYANFAAMEADLYADFSAVIGTTYEPGVSEEGVSVFCSATYGGKLNQFCANQEMYAKWQWLFDEVIAHRVADGKSSIAIDSNNSWGENEATMRFEIDSFLRKAVRENWPASSNYTNYDQEALIARISTVPTETIKLEGSQVYVLPVLFKENYKLAGWVDETGALYVGKIDSSFGGSKLTPKFVGNSHTITFDVEGVEAVATVYGDKIGDLPVPTKENHEFQGWYVDEVLLTKNTVCEGDIAATAKFVEVWDVTLDFAGGDKQVSSIDEVKTVLLTEFYNWCLAKGAFTDEEMTLEAFIGETGADKKSTGLWFNYIGAAGNPSSLYKNFNKVDNFFFDYTTLKNTKCAESDVAANKFFLNDPTNFDKWSPLMQHVETIFKADRAWSAPTSYYAYELGRYMQSFNAANAYVTEAQLATIPESLQSLFVKADGTQTKRYYSLSPENVLPAVSKEGFEFLGWSDGEAEVTAINDAALRGKTITATFKQIVAQIGANNYETLKDAFTAAADNDTIMLYPGEHTLDFVINKMITFKGSDKDTVIIKVTKDLASNVDSSYVRFDTVTIKGENATGGGAGVYFQATANTSEFICENCNIQSMNTFIKFQMATTNPVVINISKCNVSYIGQFFLWVTKGIDTIEISESTFDLATCGSVTNANAALLRVRDGSIKVIGNTFNGTVQDIDGIIECGVDSEGGVVKYNKFNNVTEFAHINGSTNKPVEFNNNLYLNAEGVALAASPVSGDLITADVTVYATVEELNTAYEAYKNK